MIMHRWIACFFAAVEDQEEKWQISQYKERDNLRTEDNGALGKQLVRNNYKAWAWVSHALNLVK